MNNSPCEESETSTEREVALTFHVTKIFEKPKYFGIIQLHNQLRNYPIGSDFSVQISMPSSSAPIEMQEKMEHETCYKQNTDVAHCSNSEVENSDVTQCGILQGKNQEQKTTQSNIPNSHVTRSLGYLSFSRCASSKTINYVIQILNSNKFQNEINNIATKDGNRSDVMITVEDSFRHSEKQIQTSETDQRIKQSSLVFLLQVTDEAVTESKKIIQSEEVNKIQTSEASTSTHELPNISKENLESTTSSSVSNDVSPTSAIFPITNDGSNILEAKQIAPNVVIRDAEESGKKITEFNRMYSGKPILHKRLFNSILSPATDTSSSLRKEISGDITSAAEAEITKRFVEILPKNLISLPYQPVENKPSTSKYSPFKNSGPPDIHKKEKNRPLKHKNRKIVSEDSSNNMLSKQSSSNSSSNSSPISSKRIRISNVIETTTEKLLKFPDDELVDLLDKLDECSISLKKSCDRIVDTYNINLEYPVSAQGDTLKLVPAKSCPENNQDCAQAILEVLKTVSMKIFNICEDYKYILKKTKWKNDRSIAFKESETSINGVKDLSTQVTGFTENLTSSLLKYDLQLPEICKMTWLVRSLRKLFYLLEHLAQFYYDRCIMKTKKKSKKCKKPKKSSKRKLKVLTALEKIFKELISIKTKLETIESVQTESDPTESVKTESVETESNGFEMTYIKKTRAKTYY